MYLPGSQPLLLKQSCLFSSEVGNDTCEFRRLSFTPFYTRFVKNWKSCWGCGGGTHLWNWLTPYLYTAVWVCPQKALLTTPGVMFCIQSKRHALKARDCFSKGHLRPLQNKVVSTEGRSLGNLLPASAAAWNWTAEVGLAHNLVPPPHFSSSGRTPSLEH